MFAIFKREFNSYFTNPMGYVFLAVFYFFSGMYFSMILQYNTTDITYVFSYLFEVLMFIIPLLCMRLMSEEKRAKTDQLLMTSPVSITGLVLGKFLAALAIYGIALAVTVVYAVILTFFATPEWAVIVGNIFGSLIMGAAMIAICLLISACTESQIIAAIGGLAAMLFFVDDRKRRFPAAHFPLLAREHHFPALLLQPVRQLLQRDPQHKRRPFLYQRDRRLPLLQRPDHREETLELTRNF